MLRVAGALKPLRFVRFAAAAPKKQQEYSELEAPPSQVPLLDQLVGYYVNIQARKMYYKDSIRMEHQAVRWAFADVRKNSEALAHGFLQTGLRPGDRVLAIQPSICEALVLQYACAKVGALCCMMPHQKVTTDKLRYYFNEFQPRHFVGREWITIPETKGTEVIERNMHFWDMIYNTIPELGNSYPGQYFQWVHSTEFLALKKVFITDHNVNLLCTTPLRRILVWGPFSYYEQRLRRLSALLHPDDPILALEDPKPPVEDKKHVVFTHSNCVNAGFILSNILQFKAETRFGVLPNHHFDPIGSILAPYAGLTSGAVMVQLHDNLFNDDHALTIMEKLCVEEVSVIFGKKVDFDHLLKHAGNFDADQYEHLKWVALFEDGLETTVSDEYLVKLKNALHLDDVFVFRGTFETCYLTTYRSIAKGDLGAVPHTSFKIVGDRGTVDAKILARGARGNLKIKGPHVTSRFYNNAGLLTELLDEKGFCSTSREGYLDTKGQLILTETQIY